MGKIIDIFVEFAKSTGVAMFFADGGWKNLIMIILACVLLFLAIKKKFEPYLLLPIAFSVLLVNLPGAGDEQDYQRWIIPHQSPNIVIQDF